MTGLRHGSTGGSREAHRCGWEDVDPEERQRLLLAKESGLYLVAKEQKCGKIKTGGYLKWSYISGRFV